MKQKISLAEHNPNLAAEWHPTKNASLTPSMITPGSKKKVWWIGPCGHEWDATINSRNSGNKCPVCAGKRVLPGYNDLTTTNPILAAEWHPTKNDMLSPEMVTSQSSKKVWWLGRCGHEWAAMIANRRNGSGCPICASESQTSFPEQAIMFYLNQVTRAENRYLLNNKIEIDVYLPEYKIGIEYDGVRWHKGLKRDVDKTQYCEQNGVRLIRIREPGCPSIIGECIALESFGVESLVNAIQQLANILIKPIDIDIDRDRREIYEQYIHNKKKNSLAVKHPEIASEWHPTKNGKLTPEQMMAGTTKKVWWLGKCGHEWLSSIYDRRNGSGCPYCSGHKVLKGFNDLLTICPEIAKEWHPTKNGNLTPEQVTKSSQKKIWWQCTKGHEWQTTVASRGSGRNCPYCSGNNVLFGFNDLATIRPDLAAEWHPAKNGNLTPEQVTCGSGQKVWWIGKCGHEWDAKIQKRATQQHGCPYCSSHRLLPGVNDLATTNPELVVEWNQHKNGDLTPKDVMGGARKKVWWICAKSHEWQAAVKDRTGAHHRGCPVCAGRSVQVGFNDLASTMPALAVEWHPTRNDNLTPSMVTLGSNRKVWWVCLKGHEYQAKVYDRIRERGCPICAGKQILLGYNDLASQNKELASQWHPTKNGELTPKNVTSKSNKKVWWICVNGHEWEALISSRSNGKGCPYCAERNRNNRNI